MGRPRFQVPPHTHESLIDGGTLLEAAIGDLDHYDSSDFATDFAASDLANLGTKAHSSLTGIGVDDHHARNHAATHGPSAADALRLDDLESPQDNTDLNVSTSAHGLCPKLPNDASKYLNGVGGWTVPAGGGSHNLLSATHTDTVAESPPTRGDLLTGDDSTPCKWVTLAIGTANRYLYSDGTDLKWSDAPIQISPVYVVHSTAAKVFDSLHKTSGGRYVLGIGVTANLSGTALVELGYRLPAVWPGSSGHAKMKIQMISSATSGNLGFTLKWGSYSSGDLDALSLTTETKETLTLSAADTFYDGTVALTGLGSGAASRFLYVQMEITTTSAPAQIVTVLEPVIQWV